VRAKYEESPLFPENDKWNMNRFLLSFPLNPEITPQRREGFIPAYEEAEAGLLPA
jgi:hypothetical protein